MIKAHAEIADNVGQWYADNNAQQAANNAGERQNRRAGQERVLHPAIVCRKGAGNSIKGLRKGQFL